MAEDYTLTTPIVVSTDKLKITMLHFDWASAFIEVRLVGQNNTPTLTGYGLPGSPPEEREKAISMMKFLNTANLTTKSLHKRVLEELEKDGKLPAGDVTGTPDPVAPPFDAPEYADAADTSEEAE